MIIWRLLSLITSKSKRKVIRIKLGRLRELIDQNPNYGLRT